MNANELISHIEELNKKVLTLNSERQRQLGLLEATRKQFEACVENYKTVYGVQLTAENLSEEYTKVMNNAQAAANELEKKIQYITSGAYKQEVKKPEPVVQTIASSGATTAPTGFNGFGTIPETTNSNGGMAQPIGVAQPVNTVSSVGIAQPVNVAAPIGIAQPMQSINNAGGMGVAQPTAVNMQELPFDPDPPKVEGVAKTEVKPMGVDAEEDVKPLNWGTVGTPVQAGGVDNMLTGMFGNKFGG